MTRGTVRKILDVQEQIRADNVLLCDYEKAQTAFLEMLPGLTDTQRNILMDYLGICVELHLRMLEKAIDMK